MSKPPQKHKRSRSPIDHHKHVAAPPTHQGGRLPDSAKLLSKPIVVLIIIAILTAIPFCMGKYFEFNSPSAFDSGAYVYSAKRILDGAKIGIDEKPSWRVLRKAACVISGMEPHLGNAEFARGHPRPRDVDPRVTEATVPRRGTAASR